MKELFFYSTPDSATPSPYFRRFPHMLRDISRKGILKFRLWTGTHDAPRPVEEDDTDTLDGKLHDAVLVNRPSLNGIARSTAVCQEGK